MEGPKLPPLLYQSRKLRTLKGCKIADVIRCRKRALEFCAHPIPVFSPLDDPQVVEEGSLVL